MTEHPVHDKGNTNHVTAVFQDRQKQEQDCHLRYETKDSAYTADYTIHNKACYYIVGADAFQESAYDFLNAANEGIICPVCYNRADRGNRDVIYYEHNCDKDRDTEDTVCNDLIDFIRSCQLILAFFHSRANNLLNEFITLIGYDTFHIVIMRLFQTSS